jgi:hypothetical protein
VEYSSSEFIFLVELHGTHPSEPLGALCVVGRRDIKPQVVVNPSHYYLDQSRPIIFYLQSS